jgi:hypothetical protein
LLGGNAATWQGGGATASAGDNSRAMYWTGSLVVGDVITMQVTHKNRKHETGCDEEEWESRGEEHEEV